MDKCINTFKKVVSSDNFLQLQRKKINFPILTIKADQICEEILRHSLHVKNIVQRKGETKNFRVFSQFFTIHRSSILTKIILDNSSSCHGDARGSYKILRKTQLRVVRWRRKRKKNEKKEKEDVQKDQQAVPPEGAKEPFKIFNAVSWWRPQQRGEDLKEESSSSFPTPRKQRATREKRNLKAPYHWIPFSLRASHTSRGTMQCRSNSGTVQLLPDQTSRSREARSLVASVVLPVMSRCAEDRRRSQIEKR